MRRYNFTFWFIFISYVALFYVVLVYGAENIITDDQSGQINTINKNFQESENLAGKHIKPKKITCNDITGTFIRTYSNVLSAAETSVTISSLDGNTDIEYELYVYFVSGASGWLTLRLNADTGNNYYWAGVTVSTYTHTSTGGYPDSSVGLCSIGTGTNYAGFAKISFYAKSGKARTGVFHTSNIVGGTSGITGIAGSFHWFNNTDNITSITITGPTNGLGVGTSIELWTRK